jgi:hypothetical protein
MEWGVAGKVLQKIGRIPNLHLSGKRINYKHGLSIGKENPMNVSFTRFILLAIRTITPIAILFSIGEVSSRLKDGPSFPAQAS